MTVTLLEQPAIVYKYTGTLATWCKGGCGKFRYPAIFVNDKPHCERCAVAAGLTGDLKNSLTVGNSVFSRSQVESKVLKLLEESPTTVSRVAKQLSIVLQTAREALNALIDKRLVITKRVGTNKNSIVWYGLAGQEEKLSCCIKSNPRGLRAIAEKIHDALANEPLSTKQLAKLLNKHPTSITDAALILIREGRAICKRQGSGGNRRVIFYARPEQRQQLLETAGQSLEELLLEILQRRTLSISEAAELLPNHNPKWVGKKLSQMAKSGLLISQGPCYRRIYALPEHKDLLAQTMEEHPIRQQIIQLLGQEEQLWQTEIAKRLSLPPSTLRLHLNHLVETGKLLKDRPGQVYYRLADK